MKTIFFIIFSVFGQLAAQTFEKNIDFGMEEEIIESIELENRTTVHASIFGLQSFQFPLSTKCLLFKLDTNGNLINSIVIKNMSPLSLKLKGDTIVLLGTGNSIEPVKSKVVFLDTTLGIIDSIIYTKPFLQALTGGQFHIDNNGDLFKAVTLVDSNDNWISNIVQYDASNNLIKETTYDSTSSINNIGGGGLVKHQTLNNFIMHQVGELNTNSLFLFNNALQISRGGNFRTGDTNSVYNSELYLGWPPNFLHVLPNGNIAMSGAPLNPASSSNSLDEQPDIGLIIYDTLLNQTNVQIMGAPDTGDTPGIKSMTSDKDYLYLVATKGWSIFNYYGTNSTFTRLMKFDFNGNFISENVYSHSDKTRVNCIIKSMDGGFILSGYSYDSLNLGSQGMNAYILKVDSSGNLITGIDEKNLNLTANDFLIYPNPARKNLILQKINYFEPYLFKLYNVNGQEVLNFNWINNQENLSIERLPKGIYFYRIESNERGTFSGKIIKQ